MTYKFITGRDPATMAIRPETRPQLSGRITGITSDLYNNIGVKRARLVIFPVDRETGARRDGAVFAQTTGEGGAWGPFSADPGSGYEFAIVVPGQPVTHVYRSPFPRSSTHIHLRPAKAVSNPQDASAIVMTRPRIFRSRRHGALRRQAPGFLERPRAQRILSDASPAIFAGSAPSPVRQ